MTLVYVVGLAFTSDRSAVALMTKRRPQWQVGKLNGPGGKVEDGETPEQAMAREFQEECGVIINPEEWTFEAILKHRNKEWLVCFYSYVGNKTANVTPMTDETVHIWPIRQVLFDNRLMPNLKMFIPLALDTSGIIKPLLIEDHMP